MNETQRQLLKKIWERGSYAPTLTREKNAMTRLLNKGYVCFCSVGRYTMTDFGVASKAWIK